MKKILIIGSPGSGKSTLSKKIAKSLHLPLVHLDKLFWNEGWIESSEEEFDHRLMQILMQNKWIIDGNYSRTMPIRLERADTVIFLDYSRYVCTWRVIKRVLKAYGTTRSDMGKGCPERFDLEFLKYVWNFRKTNRSKILHLLSGVKEKEIIVIHNNKEINRFLSKIRL